MEFVFAVMSCRLDMLVAAEREAKIKRKRVVSDPQVSTAQVEQCLARHLQQVRSKDLHSLVMPPAEGPLKWNFQCRASPAWMAKVAGLCWDLVHDVARNSKINSSKLQPAILGLLKAGQIENLSGKKEREFAESIDFTIRVLLNWFRQCATSEEQRSLVYKKLSDLQKTKAHM